MLDFAVWFYDFAIVIKVMLKTNAKLVCHFAFGDATMMAFYQISTRYLYPNKSTLAYFKLCLGTSASSKNERCHPKRGWPAQAGHNPTCDNVCTTW